MFNASLVSAWKIIQSGMGLALSQHKILFFSTEQITLRFQFSASNYKAKRLIKIHSFSKIADTIFKARFMGSFSW